MTNFKTGLLLSYICMASVSAAIVTPALPLIEQSYALGHGAIEWMVSLFLLGYVSGQLIYGPIANRFGRLNAIRSGLVLNVIGIIICLLSANSHDYSGLLFGRLISGLGAAAGLTITFTLINELLPTEKAKQALSYAIFSFTIGIGVAVTIGGLITQYAHWKYCFFFLLAHAGIMFCLTWQFPETLKHKLTLHPLHILKKYAAALKSIQLVAYSFILSIVASIAYCYSAAAPLIAKTRLSLSPDYYGYWNLINIIGMLGSGVICAYCMKTLKPKHILFMGYAGLIISLSSLILFTLMNSNNTIWFFITTMLLYFFTGFIFPAGSYFASNAIEDRASASSMMSFLYMGISMISVIIMGYLPLSTLMSYTVTLTIFTLSTLGVLLFIRNHQSVAVLTNTQP